MVAIVESARRTFIGIGCDPTIHRLLAGDSQSTIHDWQVLDVVLLVGWLLVNPPGRFGICTFGLTTYGCIPYPASDIQVRGDGHTRSVEKTHALGLEHVRWLLDPMPACLIIGIGWDGAAMPGEGVKRVKGCEVQILKTGEAVREHNRRKERGEDVAIHVHSTC